MRLSLSYHSSKALTTHLVGCLFPGSPRSGPAWLEVYAPLDCLIYCLLIPCSGDSVLVQGSQDGRPTFRGFVHDIRLEHVCVKFHPSFKSGWKYNVRFELSRTSVKRQHQALLTPPTESTERLLFPRSEHAPLDRAIPLYEDHSKLFNTQIGNNAPQLQAVKSILNMKEDSAPFILFGP